MPVSQGDLPVVPLPLYSTSFHAARGDGGLFYLEPLFLGELRLLNGPPVTAAELALRRAGHRSRDGPGRGSSGLLQPLPGPQPGTASGYSGGTRLSDLFSAGITVSFLFGSGGADSFSESLPSLPSVGRSVK